jgi:hypothetical protein
MYINMNNDEPMLPPEGPEAEELVSLRLLKDILQNSIMQKKKEKMHRTQNRVDTIERIGTEIETL